MKIIIMLIIILSVTYVNVFAFNIGDVIQGARDFLTDANNAASSADVDTKISGTIKSLASAGLAIGTIVAVCSGIVIAISSMANGAYGKAHLKEALTPYIIACVVLFAAWGIWAAVVEIMENSLQ
ncbi:MAG: hypothetical protein E7311_03005 [Clostridiales bacterium]|nr:hypothetical protein [Clostridiales bacterium]